MSIICSATDISHSALRAAMNEAFADYAVPMRLSADAFDLMMLMRSLDKTVSCVALIDGEIAAFWLIGRRDDRAYLISSGTVPRFRRRGLSKAVGETVIEHLMAGSLGSIQTEVLSKNTAARSLYRSLGFYEKRILDCYTLRNAPPRKAPRIASVTHWDMSGSDAERLWDVAPSWQNDTPSLSAASDHTKCIALHDEAGLAAYAAFVPVQGSLAQLAVRSDRRREGLATLLLTQALAGLRTSPLKLLNVDRADTGLSAFLRVSGAEMHVSQKELFREL